MYPAMDFRQTNESPPFGAWLKARRTAFGFTRKELASLVGCSEVTVIKLETGERRPSTQIAGLLADALGIPAEERHRFVEFARANPHGQTPPPLPQMGARAAGSGRRVPSSSSNLPSPPTSFVGHDRELASAGALLGRPDVRLLTFTGPPGIGKTRMSLRVAGEMAARFEHGALFVGLASVRDPGALPEAIAQALSIRESTAVHLFQSIKEHLRGKQLLLVLDNFEQLVPAAPLLGELLTSNSDLKMLVSSREPLSIYGEFRFPLEPLSLPAGEEIRPGDLSGYGAVRLFIDRALAVEPSFELTERNAPSVVDICRGLQGVPLAIELAAARTWELSLQEILAGLGEKLSLLTYGPRDLPSRQQSLRGAIDWSYDLLSDGERRLLRRLSVFAGGCTWEAMESVCDGEEAPAGDLRTCAAALVRKSLLKYERAQGEEDERDQEPPRYVMLETIREYALERLAESGEAEALRLKHAIYYAALVEAEEPFLNGSRQAARFEALEREHYNLRAALDWCAGGGPEPRRIEPGLRLAGALGAFWEMRGYPGEGRAYLEQLLALSHDSAKSAEERAWRMKALGVAGRLALYQGDFQAARTMYEQSLSICRELDDKPSIAAKLNDLGVAARAGGDYDYARALYEESLQLRRELGNAPGIARSLNSLGTVMLALGDYDRAHALAEESLRIRRELGDKSGIALCTANLGEIERSLGNFDAAGRHYEESLQLNEETGDRPGVANALHNLGQVALHDGKAAGAKAFFEQALATYREWEDRPGIAECLAGLAEVAVIDGDAERAAVLFGASGALLAATGFRLSRPDQSQYEESLALARDRLGEQAYEARESEGWTLALDEAIAYAL